MRKQGSITYFLSQNKSKQWVLKLSDIQIANGLFSALTDKVDLYTWCSDKDYKYYSGREDSYPYYQPIKISSDVKTYSLGRTSFILQNDGKLLSFGQNEHGKAGTGAGTYGYNYGTDRAYSITKPTKILTNVKAVTHDSVNRMMYLKNDGFLWATGSGKYGVLSELDEENSTQYNFYRNPILITLKGKSPSLTVKDGNNSGTTDPEEPDSGDIDDGDYGHDQGNKDNAGDKQQDQVGGQIKPSTPATKKPSTITTIAVSGTNILKIQNVKGKKVKIRWKKNTKVAGYQIQYSMKKNFKSGMKTIYSKWSSVKKVKIKK